MPSKQRSPRNAHGRSASLPRTGQGQTGTMGALRPTSRRSASQQMASDSSGRPPSLPASPHHHTISRKAEGPAPEGERLNKYLARMGLCSRREADDWIARGWVQINGKPVQMGQKLLPGDQLDIRQAARDRQQEQVTILLNKPVGYVSGQAEDGHQPALVLIDTASRWKEDHSPRRFDRAQLRGLAAAGRLDIDSMGLLVLTQDGRVARQLIGETSQISKEYLVRVRFGPIDRNVQQAFPAERLTLLCHGLSLDGKVLKAAQVSWQNSEQLRFILHEGRHRQIRRMCELVGLTVTGLKRIRIGNITLGRLPSGQWRYLRPDESF